MTDDELPDSLRQFDFALDTVGGPTLPKALGSLVPGGTCLAIGSLGGEVTQLDVAAFLSRSLRLEGFYLFDELSQRGARAPLQRLMTAVQRGHLRPKVGIKAPWAEVSRLAEILLTRGVTGKIVLHVSATGDSALPGPLRH
jgi:NADPH:quinone reductase-like Zn-dependent oxidoreductase